MSPKLRKDRSTPGAKPAPKTTSNKFEPLCETHQLKTPSKHASTTMVDDAPTKPPSELQFDTMKDDIASMAQVIKSLSTSLHKMDKLDKIDIIEARQKSTEITDNDLSMSKPGSNKGAKVPKNVTTIPNVNMMTTSKEDDTIMQHRTNSTVLVPKLPTVTYTDNDHDLEDDSSNENNKTFPIKTHKYWRIAATEIYQPHRFLHYMENIKLNDDTISHLRQFYERIRLAFHSSFSKLTDILPTFKQISPNHPFDQLLIPENQYII